MAINRAEPRYFNKSFSEFAELNNSASKCVFLSLKSEDKETAIRIGNYILEAGIDIYLDKNDAGLQGAVKNGDDENIVKYIEKGIQASTHMMCIISQATQISWWVPYEIGFAKKSGKAISSLKLKGISNLPSYLKIVRQLNNIKMLNQYLEEISYGVITEPYYSSTNSLSLLMEKS